MLVKVSRYVHPNAGAEQAGARTRNASTTAVMSALAVARGIARAVGGGAVVVAPVVIGWERIMGVGARNAALCQRVRSIPKSAANHAERRACRNTVYVNQQPNERVAYEK